MSPRPQGLGALGIKSRVSLAVVAFAFAGWVAIGAPGIANAAKESRSGHGGTTFRVIEHAVNDTVIHSGGGTGDVTGNSLTFHNKVYNPADVKVVGADQGYCVRIVPAESYECNWTTFLPGGQITVEGPFYDKKNSVLAITGGTGAFRKARGDMNLNSRKGGTEYDFIFHLS